MQWRCYQKKNFALFSLSLNISFFLLFWKRTGDEGEERRKCGGREDGITTEDNRYIIVPLHRIAYRISSITNPSTIFFF